MISWRNPGKEQADWDLDTYARAIIDAIDAALEITGSDDSSTFSALRRRDHHLDGALPPRRDRATAASTPRRSA